MYLKLLLTFALIFSCICSKAQVIEKHYGNRLHRYTLLKPYNDSTYLFEELYDSVVIFKSKTTFTKMYEYGYNEEYCIDTCISFDWNGDTIVMHTSNSNSNGYHYTDNYRSHFNIDKNKEIFFGYNTYFYNKKRLKITTDSGIYTYKLRQRNFNHFVLRSYLYDPKTKTYIKPNFEKSDLSSFKKVGFRTYIETTQKDNLYSSNLLRYHYPIRYNSSDKYWFSDKKAYSSEVLSVYQYGLKTDSLNVKNNYKFKSKVDGYGNFYSYKRFFDKKQYYYQSKNYTKHLYTNNDTVFYRDTFFDCDDTFLYNAQLFGTNFQYNIFKNGIHVLKGEKNIKPLSIQTNTVRDFWIRRIKVSYNLKRYKKELFTFGARDSKINPYEMSHLKDYNLLDISHWSNNNNLEKGCTGDITQLNKYFRIDYNDDHLSIEGHYETMINHQALIYEKHNKYGIIDHKGSIYPAIYDSVSQSGDNLIAKRDDGVYELIFLNTKHSKKIVFKSIDKSVNHCILNNDSCVYIIHQNYEPFIIPIQNNSSQTRILLLFENYRLTNPFLRSTVFLKSSNRFYIRSVDKCDWNNYTFNNLIIHKNYIIAQYKDTIFRFGFNGKALGFKVGYDIKPQLMELPHNLENYFINKTVGFVVKKNSKYGIMDENFKWILKDSFDLVNLKSTFIVTLKDSNFQLFSWVYAPRIVPYKSKRFETIYNEDSSKYWTGINQTSTLIYKQSKLNDWTLLDSNKNMLYYSSKFKLLKNYYKDSINLNNGTMYYIFVNTNQYKYILRGYNDTILKGSYSDVRIINSRWAYVKQTNQAHYKLIDYTSQKTFVDSLNIDQTSQGIHRNYYTNLLGYIDYGNTPFVTAFKYQEYFTIPLESGREAEQILVLRNKKECVGLYQNSFIPLPFERLYYHFYDTRSKDRLYLMGYKMGTYYTINNTTITDSSEDIYWDYKPSKELFEYLNWKGDTTQALDSTVFRRSMNEATEKSINLKFHNTQMFNTKIKLFEVNRYDLNDRLKDGFLLDRLNEW